VFCSIWERGSQFRVGSTSSENSFRQVLTLPATKNINCTHYKRCTQDEGLLVALRSHIVSEIRLKFVHIFSQSRHLQYL
jgi:hypothetical protein